MPLVFFTFTVGFRGCARRLHLTDTSPPAEVFALGLDIVHCRIDHQDFIKPLSPSRIRFSGQFFTDGVYSSRRMRAGVRSVGWRSSAS
eukprot:6462912-Pyramimonas_sp.AAC.1